MTADVAVTAAASLLMFGYGPLFYAVTRRRNKRAEDARRRARAAEWSRLQAAVKQARADIAAEAEEGTPLYDRLVCEQIEKAEGWAS